MPIIPPNNTHYNSSTQSRQEDINRGVAALLRSINSSRNQSERLTSASQWIDFFNKENPKLNFSSFSLIVKSDDFPYIETDDNRKFVICKDSFVLISSEFFNSFKDSIGILDDEVVSVKILFEKEKLVSVITERAMLYAENFVRQLSEYKLLEIENNI